MSLGATVYLDPLGNWVEEIDKARVFLPEEAEAKEAALAATKRTLRIVSLETETVKLVDGKVVADRLRERIRATGSTAARSPDRARSRCRWRALRHRLGPAELERLRGGRGAPRRGRTLSGVVPAHVVS